MEKILFYIDSMGRGGAQRVMNVLSDYYCELGFDTILVNNFYSETRVEYNVNPKIKRLYLGDNNGNTIIKNLRWIYSLRKIIKIEKPDIIISFMGLPNKRMLIASLGIKIPKIVSVRNDPNVEYGTGCVTKTITNILFHRANGIVFQTDEAMRYFDKKNQSKGTVIFNPIGNNFYDVKRNIIDKRIITCGRLDKQKNHELLIAAFEKISNEIIHDLYIFGEGKERKALEKYCAERNLTNRVHFPGNTEDVALELSKASLFVLSSDFEGMPNALMEAMASGTPCISTDCPCGGPKALFGKYAEKYLVPCNDVDALASKMLKAINANQTTIEKEIRQCAEQFRTATVLKEWMLYIAKIENEFRHADISNRSE